MKQARQKQTTTQKISRNRIYKSDEMYGSKYKQNVAMSNFNDGGHFEINHKARGKVEING